jgi:hypothetical protein
MPNDVRSKPSHDSLCLVIRNLSDHPSLTESWYCSWNGRMPIAGYYPKIRRSAYIIQYCCLGCLTRQSFVLLQCLLCAAVYTRHNVNTIKEVPYQYSKIPIFPSIKNTWNALARIKHYINFSLVLIANIYIRTPVSTIRRYHTVTYFNRDYGFGCKACESTPLVIPAGKTAALFRYGTYFPLNTVYAMAIKSRFNG